MDAAEDELIRAKNQLVTAKSNCQKAKVDLGYAMIYSPISGVVLNKAVEEGQTVASSFNTPTLFTIAIAFCTFKDLSIAGLFDLVVKLIKYRRHLALVSFLCTIDVEVTQTDNLTLGVWNESADIAVKNQL